jgi:Cu/Ag efflux protein CusF
MLLCALVSGLAFVQPLQAQDEKKTSTTTEQAPAEKKAKRKGYKGTIDTIDASAKTVTVKKATTSKTFKLADDAKFVTSDNKNATLADLKQGDLVNVRFSDDGDMPVAHRIAHAAKKEATETTE